MAVYEQIGKGYDLTRRASISRSGFILLSSIQHYEIYPTKID